MDEKTKSEVEKIVEEKIRIHVLPMVKSFLKSTAFTDKKVTDIPTDNLDVVNRLYVNLNGTTANRPRTSVLAQKYFDTTIGRPIYWNGSAWVDGAGSIS